MDDACDDAVESPKLLDQHLLRDSAGSGNTVECTFETWERVSKVNLTGTWLGMKYQIPAMVKNGGGAIVNMASVAALRAFESYPAYSASKRGVVGLSKVAAKEFAPKGVRVNVVGPGAIDTPLFIETIEKGSVKRRRRRRVQQRRLRHGGSRGSAKVWPSS